MSYLVVVRGLAEKKVEECSTMENAQRVAEKWCRELHCEALIAEVVGAFKSRTEWCPRVAVAVAEPGAAKDGV